MSIQILEWISNIRGRPNVTKPNSTCHNDKTKSAKINRGHYYNETLILSLIIDKFYLKSFSLLLQIKNGSVLFYRIYQNGKFYVEKELHPYKHHFQKKEESF